jgi:hypothetical protein
MDMHGFAACKKLVYCHKNSGRHTTAAVYKVSKTKNAKCDLPGSNYNTAPVTCGKDKGSGMNELRSFMPRINDPLQGYEGVAALRA